MNDPIKFDQIRSDAPDGQRGAFEELVCQLAHLQAPDGNSFRRIDGSGGDGGVECVHKSSDGGIAGYQAKYYLNSDEIDWKAIDRSVRTALAVYTDLDTYIIALPCDLTSKRRVKGGHVGDGVWGKWDEWSERWQAEAAALGRSVRFVHWTAHELRMRLMSSEAAGLRKYWFNAVEFSSVWFKRHAELAFAALEDRYHPEDHVDVASQELFEIITRDPKIRKKLTSYYKAIAARKGLLQSFAAIDPKPPGELMGEASRTVESLLLCEKEVLYPIWQPWEIDRWKHLTASAITSVEKLSQWSLKAESESKETSHHYRRYELPKLTSALQEFHQFLDRRFFSTERSRLVLLDGRAGSGKSHLLARVAETAVANHRAVVLLLGQQLRDEQLWPQILRRLDLSGASVDEFLGALNSAAECLGTRGLILVDAINEGPGASLWRVEIGSLLAQIKQYSNLACVVSCRSEYVDYLVPSGVLATLPRIEIRGFETPEEQANAARVYLDKRGISRPATPWLAPEFVNPLFLRSCCVALNRDGKDQFPRGLSGTKAIMAFFIDSVARHLGAGRDGSNELVSPTNKTLAEIAIRMAENRQNYLNLESSHEIANRHFKLFPLSGHLSWLEQLNRNGLLRFDPNPEATTVGRPLHVVRFAFQRFQDHLIAEALLAAVADAKHAFIDGGSLAFIHDGKHVKWEWRGVSEALSIQLPERLKLEFVDALPGGAGQWWQEWDIQDAFAESVRWRGNEAFSDRTLELFNSLFDVHRKSHSLLIELSASVNHPWNADLIHQNLVKRSLADRDAFWSVEINAATWDDSHAIHRLIDWCSRSATQHASPETARLCSLILTWCFAASSRQIRDRATKALTAIMVYHPQLFSELLRAFDGVDDLYVLERLFGAAFGVCCIDKSAERVRSYAELTAETLFSGSTPPLNLLLRDYGRGIIELAQYLDVLPESVNLAVTSPPYVSVPPRLNLTKETVQKVASLAGDNTILQSCEYYGDFGRYDIEYSVRSFTTVRLSRRAPLAGYERLSRFEREVINPDPARIAALMRLRDVKALDFRVVQRGKELSRRKLTQKELQRWVDDLAKAEKELLALLNAKERRVYLADVRSELGLAIKQKRPDPKHVDPGAAKLWVAKRAYEFGWTRSRFPGERFAQDFQSGDRRPEVERIGKKYQWLALSELLCRLADNYWIAGGAGDHTRKYDYSTDIGSIRDIDPTVFPVQEGLEAEHSYDWTAKPKISIPPTSEEQLTKWPFLDDPGMALAKLIFRVDPDGRVWSTLYEHRNASAKYQVSRVPIHGYRQQEFRFVCCVLIDKSRTAALIEHLNATRKIDVHSWDPPEFTDEPYLLEAPWRKTWPNELRREDGWAEPVGLGVTFAVFEYRWESHLDASLPAGARAFVLPPWVVNHLNLSHDRIDPSIVRDLSGKIRFIGSTSNPDGSIALIDSQSFRQLLDERSLECVWLFIAERTALPGGEFEKAVWRRSAGFCRIENGRPVVVTWNDDSSEIRGSPS